MSAALSQRRRSMQLPQLCLLFSVLHELDTSFYTEGLKLFMKGLRKRRLAQGVIPKACNPLLTSALVKLLVTYFDATEVPELSVLTLISWDFLLRIQSEASGLEVGKESEATVLPDGRRSGVWAQDNLLVVRLMRRKHRPHGSILKRRCACSGNAQFCVVCRTRRYILDAKQGDRLFCVTGSMFLRRLRLALSALGVAHGDMVTLKAFRAGMATEMARLGKTLGEILLAGEWTSRASLHYTNVGLLDQAIFLTTTIDGSV